MEQLFGILMNAGVAGAVLWVVLARIEPALDRLKDAISENSKQTANLSGRIAMLRRVNGSGLEPPPDRYS